VRRYFSQGSRKKKPGGSRFEGAEHSMLGDVSRILRTILRRLKKSGIGETAL
jgi:hypothetical protein